MNSLEAVLQARKMLAEVTPLRRDCGRVCGTACCAPDEDGQGGMLLLPGEEALYAPLPPGFCLTRNDDVLPGMGLLTCSGRCDRALRPLSCRMFPLTPVIRRTEGRSVLQIIMDPRAFSVCPLAEGGLRGVDSAFCAAVRESARLLCRCAEHREYFVALGKYFQRLRAW